MQGFALCPCALKLSSRAFLSWSQGIWVTRRNALSIPVFGSEIEQGWPGRIAPNFCMRYPGSGSFLGHLNIDYGRGN